MKRLAHLLSVLLLGALALATTSCGWIEASDMSIIIVGDVVPGDGCVIAASGSTFLSMGRLDVTATSNYLLTPIIRNGTTLASSSSNPNLHVAFVQGADVELKSVPAQASVSLVNTLASMNLTKRSQYFSATVEPNGGTAGTAFTVVDMDQITAMAGLVKKGSPVQVIAHVTLFGQMDGGGVSSPGYDFPITVCRDCLVNDVGSCSGMLPSTIRSGSPCGIQDEVVDCCENGATLVCPARAP